MRTDPLITFAVLMLALLALPRCTPDAVTPWGASEDCAGACSTLRALGCPESQPTPAGQTCVQVCEGNAELLNVGCVVKAESVAGVRSCNVRCGR